jgi:hypothetical protein
MNTPHQLNEPLTYMPIPDSPYGWQEKMFSINSLEQNFAAYTGSGIRDWMEFSCAILPEARSPFHIGTQRLIGCNAIYR